MGYLREPPEPLEAVATEGDPPDIPAAAATQAAFSIRLIAARTGADRPPGEANRAGMLSLPVSSRLERPSHGNGPHEFEPGSCAVPVACS